MGLPAVEITNFQISIQNDSQATSIEVHLTEKSTTRLNKKNRPCKEYGGSDSYNECVRKSFWSILKDQINCTLPGYSYNNLAFKSLS